MMEYSEILEVVEIVVGDIGFTFQKRVWDIVGISWQSHDQQSHLIPCP